LTPALRRELRALLLPPRTKKCPFTNLPDSRSSHWGEGITAEQMGQIVWLEPRTVAEVAFTEWTRDAHLRHAAFVDLASCQCSSQRVPGSSRNGSHPPLPKTSSPRFVGLRNLPRLFGMSGSSSS